MFLKSMVSSFVTIVILSSVSWAQERPGVEPGRYTLRSGEKRFCPNLTLTEKDLSGKSFRIGISFELEWQKSTVKRESDINPGVCEFHQVFDRISESGETTLVRKNTELCKGKLETETETRVRFQGSKIELQHSMFEKGSRASFDCEWQREE